MPIFIICIWFSVRCARTLIHVLLRFKLWRWILNDGPFFPCSCCICPRLGLGYSFIRATHSPEDIYVHPLCPILHTTMRRHRDWVEHLRCFDRMHFVQTYMHIFYFICSRNAVARFISSASLVFFFHSQFDCGRTSDFFGICRCKLGDPGRDLNCFIAALNGVCTLWMPNAEYMMPVFCARGTGARDDTVYRAALLEINTYELDVV